MRISVSIIFLLLLQGAFATPSVAIEDLPQPLQEVRFDQQLGKLVPLELPFRDTEGRDVVLADYFGEKPVVLALVYFECPMLCTMVLNGLTAALKTIDFTPGQEFEVVAVSFDATETPELAAANRAGYLQRYGRPETEDGWHFLTGEQDAIQELTDSVGFKYVYDEESGQFAHAAGIMILTPDGRLARYFYGVEYPARDIRLGLVEAADEKIGSFSDQVLLYCFHYDPVVGGYTAVTMNIVRLAALATMLAIGLFVLVHLRRDRKQQLTMKA